MSFSYLSTWWNSQPQYKQECIQGAITGATIGVGITTAVNSIEKIKARPKNNYHPKSFSKSFYRETFKGFQGAVTDSTGKSIFLFGTIPLFQRITNVYFLHQETSYLVAAICSSALLSLTLHSFQAMKSRLEFKKTKPQLISCKNLPKTTLISLVFEKSVLSTLHSSLYWVSYLYVSCYTHHQLKQKHISPSISPLISGYLGAFASSLITHPIEVIAKRKQKNPSYCIFRKGIKEINKQELKSLFKGIFKGHLTRVLIPGILIEGTFDQVDKVFKSLKNPNFSKS